MADWERHDERRWHEERGWHEHRHGGHHHHHDHQPATPPADVLVHNGDTLIERGGSPVISEAVIGRGTYTFAGPVLVHGGDVSQQLEFDNYVGRGQTIDFANNGVNSFAWLTLADVRDFHGVIKDFSDEPRPAGSSYVTQDMINIAGPALTSLRYDSHGDHGTLNLFAGSQFAGSINFAGHYTTSEFVLSNNTIKLV